MTNDRPRKKRKGYYEELFEKVPKAGARWDRWYDIPTKAAWWALKGWRKKYLPQFARDASLRAINALIQFNEFDRKKIEPKDDKYDNIHVASDEHVHVPAIVVVELFTPNEARQLEKAIRKNGWSNHRTAIYENDNNISRLKKARSKQGLSWWRLADIRERDSKYYMPDSIVGRLPNGVESASLRAVQIGSGVTAVVTSFRFSETASDELDTFWHQEFEPRIRRINGKYRVSGRLRTAHELTQQKREATHDSIRKWISEFVPGYFSSHDEKHISMDIIISEKFDPTSQSSKFADHETQNAFSALGIDPAQHNRITSPVLKGVLLQNTDRLSGSNKVSDRTWALIGKRSKLNRLNDSYKVYGGIDSGLLHQAEEALSFSLILLSLEALLSITESHFSDLRDEVNRNHKRFKVRSLKQLNTLILDASFTLSSIKQDVNLYLDKDWWHDEARLQVTIAPQYKAKLGGNYNKSQKFHELTARSIKKKFGQLSDTDRDFRDILSTVSSLGSSANNIVLARWAFFVSVLSLVAAVAALIISIYVGQNK